MTQAVELSVSYGNKRYRDAARGLHALAKSLNKSMNDYAHVLSREMKTFIRDELDKLAERHSGPITTDTTLATRTGTLVKSLKTAGTVTEAATIADVQAEIRLPGQYKVQEYGGTVKPKNGYLFVPLPDALNPDGTPKKLNPRQWQDTFIRESKAGNLILFQRVGRKLIPLYALKSQVRVRPRLGLVSQVKADFPDFADRALTALFDALTKPLN